MLTSPMEDMFSVGVHSVSTVKAAGAVVELMALFG
jgi:hypothetical protein